MERILIAAALMLAGCASMAPAETGETCVDDGDCVDGRCVEARDDTRVRYCTQVCDGDGYCPAPMHCIASTCRYPLPSPGALGASCTAAAECTDQLCVDNTCTIDCAAAGVCPGGYECRTDATGSLCLATASADSGGCGAADGSVATSLALLFALFVVRRRPWALVTCEQNA